MGKANYINRVNSFIPMKDYKLRYALNLGYDDIIEDVNELSKIKTFDTVEALQDYATNNPTAYIGQQCVLKGNPSSVYVINENKTITLIATSSNINSIVIFDNTIEQQTLISTDKILIQDTIGSFKWISFANLKRQLGLQVGQKYLGGTIIKLNEDGTSGVIASYNEFEANYTAALTTYSVNGLYSSNGYSNWRLPTISELNLLLTHSKPERALIGDVNDDGIINNKDYALIEEGLYKDSTDSEWSTKWYRADVDGNGIIDGDDQNAVENLINGGGGSIFTKLKYLSIDLSQINPLTHCKGYSAPALSMINGVITVVPHALIEIPIVDIVGVRLVRNF